MPETPKTLIAALDAECTQIVQQTLSEGREAKFADRYQFLDELRVWNEALKGSPERSLYDLGAQEYGVALLNLCQGQYRNSFKSMRLCLELYTQGVLLSADPISLHEWLSNEKHTVWATIISDDGIFSKRFSSAFFPALSEKSVLFQSMARTLYTELSEAIHGNTPRAIHIPSKIEYSDDAFSSWLEKSDTLRMVIHFILSLRHLSGMDENGKSSVSNALLDQLGHIEPVRTALGGVST